MNLPTLIMVIWLSYCIYRSEQASIARDKELTLALGELLKAFKKDDPDPNIS